MTAVGTTRDSTACAFLAALPKVDLHIHLVGSVSASTLLTLARRHPEGGVPTERTSLDHWLEFDNDFAQFGQAYGLISRLLIDASDLVELIDGLAVELAENNVRYAEVTVTPLAHLDSIPPDELGEALRLGRSRAQAAHGIELGWIFDVSGELGVKAAKNTLQWVLRHGPDGTVGFGLGGPETDAPRGLFKECFDEAISVGLHSVPHAGETVGPGSVWSALVDLRAERIGHGIRSVEDPQLLSNLAASGVALEVCPTSNLRTGAVESLLDHPLPTLLDAGVRVALGTDDPGMFGTDLTREYQLCNDVFGLSREQLVEIALAGVESAFCPPPVARRIRSEIEQFALVALRTRRRRG
ncbi:MAG TPA: adenosine deaminase [Mycobacterium sp.]|nr:adenosine deaminase [Mycobacterium sp.]